MSDDGNDCYWMVSPVRGIRALLRRQHNCSAGPASLFIIANATPIGKKWHVQMPRYVAGNVNVLLTYLEGTDDPEWIERLIEQNVKEVLEVDGLSVGGRAGPMGWTISDDTLRRRLVARLPNGEVWLFAEVVGAVDGWRIRKDSTALPTNLSTARRAAEEDALRTIGQQVGRLLGMFDPIVDDPNEAVDVEQLARTRHALDLL